MQIEDLSTEKRKTKCVRQFKVEDLFRGVRLKNGGQQSGNNFISTRLSPSFQDKQMDFAVASKKKRKI